jgi:hypothetical protein
MYPLFLLDVDGNNLPRTDSLIQGQNIDPKAPQFAFWRPGNFTAAFQTHVTAFRVVANHILCSGKSNQKREQGKKHFNEITTAAGSLYTFFVERFQPLGCLSLVADS